MATLRRYILKLFTLNGRLGMGWAVLFIGLTSGIIYPSAATADDQATTLDYQVKAAMLYKFLGYTEWPPTSFANPSTPYRIWILGANYISDELRTITAGRTINGRAIEVFSATSAEQISDPNLVFVSQDKEEQLDKLATSAEKQAFVIVTENEQGLKTGSTINLRLVNGRVGFDISLVCAQKYNLKLSARLLAVASSVEGVNRNGNY